MAINLFNDRPFTDHQKLLELQEVNGVQVGQGLNSRFSAKEIILHIAKEMRRKACATVIKIDGRFIFSLMNRPPTLTY